jgi:hypothetical protein
MPSKPNCLQEVVKLRITHITLEVDATLVKEAIETDAYWLAFVGGANRLSVPILALVLFLFVNVIAIAHALASFGCNLPSGCYDT